MSSAPRPSRIVIILSDDPRDVGRELLAHRLLGLHLRNGGERPALADAAVVYAATAPDRQGPPSLPTATDCADPAVMPLLLPVDLAAQKLGLGRRTLERLVAEGRIRSRKEGGRRYFTEADLQDYVDRIAVQPEEAS